MRTIEEIKNDLEYRLQELQEHINWGIGPVSLTDSLKRIRNLVPELAQAQDERIKKLEAKLAERKKDWQAVCAVLKGRNKCKKYAGLWKEADHAND